MYPWSLEILYSAATLIVHPYKCCCTSHSFAALDEFKKCQPKSTALAWLSSVVLHMFHNTYGSSYLLTQSFFYLNTGIYFPIYIFTLVYPEPHNPCIEGVSTHRTIRWNTVIRVIQPWQNDLVKNAFISVSLKQRKVVICYFIVQ